MWLWGEFLCLFALFKIEPAFNISFDELERKYIELSKTHINE